MVPYVSLRFLYVEVMWPFPILPPDKTCRFPVYSCTYKQLRRCCQCFPSKQWCGRSCVGEPHEKRLGALTMTFSRNVGGGWWMKRTGFKEADFLYISPAKMQLRNPPPLCWYESADWLRLGVGGNHPSKRLKWQEISLRKKMTNFRFVSEWYSVNYT